MPASAEAPRNLLLIVVDQFRADLVKGGLAGVVPTPNIDRLAAQSLWYQNHHTVITPCGPARASLLTGQYGHSHRSFHNGAPLAAHHPTLASELRKIGREPLLFGYTDTQPDPAGRAPLDPAHGSYTAPMTGFTEVLEMRDEAWSWLAYLRSKGYDVPDAEAEDFARLYQPQSNALGGAALYAAEDSDTAFLTDQVIAQLDVRKARPWHALVTYIRPHPPFLAPAPYHEMFDPAALPAPQAPPDHPFFDLYHAERSEQGMFWGFNGDQHALTPETIAKVRAAYFGLVAEVDHHIGRLLDWLDSSGQAGNTLVILTADHGEMLGDLDTWGKQVPFRQATHVPMMIRAPGVAPQVITAPTQSIDVVPTILAHFNAEIPTQMDGRPLSQAREDDAALIEMDLAKTPGHNRFSGAEGSSHAIAYEVAGWRLIEFANDLPPMLFEIPGDAPPILTRAPEIADDLRDRLLQQLIGGRPSRN